MNGDYYNYLDWLKRQGYYTGDDPYKMARSDRDITAGRGAQSWAETTGEMQKQKGLGEAFRMAGYEQYDPILEGGGGYSPEEIQNILREDELGGLDLAPEELESMGYSPEEIQQVQGVPEAERKWFQPGRQEEIFGEGRKRQREAYEQAWGGMRSAVDPNALRIQGDFRPRLEAGAAATGTELRGIAGGPGLGVSERFQEKYPMTPEERRSIETLAAGDVGARYESAIDRINRQALAEGQGAPGMGVARLRFENQAASDAARAMQEARLGASREAATREMGLETTRLGAERDIASRRAQAAALAGQMGQEALTTGEQMRMGAERDISSRLQRVAEVGGGMKLATEAGLSREEQDLARDIRDFGAGQERYIERTGQERAKGLADVRRDVAGYGAGERYRRGLLRNQLLSGRYAGIAGERLKQKEEARDWLMKQQEAARRGYETAGQQRISGQGVLGGQQATGTGQAAQYKIAKAQQPKWWERLTGTVTGGLSALGGRFGGGRGSSYSGPAYGFGGFAKGGVVTKPTYALLGEEGPEAVVPLEREEEDRPRAPRSIDYVRDIWRARRPGPLGPGAPLGALSF